MSDPLERLTAALTGRYAIERELGQGGMATVYLAEDLKHKRKVALKVLRPELAAVLGAERFVQEITTTASLQHPHILPLFDSGEADSFLYYVMPYIEGETLRDKLDRETQLGVDEAVKITTDIADALHYAHEQGVIHRDIKPENILLHNGRPMVADFGIALAVSAAAGGRMTETGLSLGTPHYMSPEQATAEKDISARSDVYSLASVLYEMVAGAPPHLGGSAQQIIMKIVTDEARPLTELRKSVPPNVAAAVAKALDKLPADRFTSAAAFSAALLDPSFTVTDTAIGQGASSGGHWKRIAIGAGALALLLVVREIVQMVVPGGPAAQVIRYELPLAMETGLVNDFGSQIAISSDGSQIVFAGLGEGGGQLWHRYRAQLDARPLPGTDGAHQPFFSPDGQRVAYVTEARELKIVSLGGEPPITLVESPSAMRAGGDWGSDGYIYFTQGDGASQPTGVARILATGGPIEQLTAVDSAAGEVAHWFPRLLPDEGVVFSVGIAEQYTADARRIAVTRIGTGTHEIVLEGVIATWAPTGHLLVVRADGALLAAPFDPGSLAAHGGVTPLLEGVGVEVLASADLTLSSSGTLMYAPGQSVENPTEIVWVDREGRAQPVDPGWTGDFTTLRLSPDGSRLAVSIRDNQEYQVWIKHLEHKTLTKLTFEGARSYRPTWTPDGNDVMFVSNRLESGSDDLYAKPADGTTAATLLLDHDQPVYEVVASDDGEWMVYRLGTGAAQDIYVGRVGSDTVLEALLAEEHLEGQPTLSPDGRWLAYVSGESGQDEVFVVPFPNVTAGRWQISQDGGSRPLWSHSGRELFFRSLSNELEVVQILPSEAFTMGTRRNLFALNGFRTTIRGFDLGADDSTFVMIRLRDPGAGHVIVVENFLEELKAKVGR